MFKKIFDRWFNKKANIRFYSLDSGVLKLFPIVTSSSVKRKFMVEEQIGDLPETLSSKNCPGIRKIITSGWILPAPADFIVQTNGDGVSIEWNEPYRFSKISSNMDCYVSTHTRSQTEPLLDNPDKTLKTVVKLETPWRFDADDDVLLLIMPVTYNNESRFTAATGILDPKYGHLLNIQLFWNVLDGKTLIRAGTPLCQLVPISRKALNIYNYNLEINEATLIDEKKEKEFNYASNCVFMPTDNLSSRLNRVINILNKYKKKG